MYPYEDRIGAVKLYIKFGKRLKVTIRQLGYPTKNSLIGWYRELLPVELLALEGRYIGATVEEGWAISWPGSE